MTEQSAGPTLTQLLAPWAVCALLGAVTPLILTWLGASERLEEPQVMVRLVGIGIYWGPGLLFFVLPRLFSREEMNGRARAADLFLQLAAGLLLFAIPMVATLWVLASHLDAVEARIDYSHFSDLRKMLRFTIWLPLGAVMLAAIARLMRRTPAAVYVGGLSLFLWLVMMTAHYVGGAEAGRDGWVGANSSLAEPVCAPSGRITLTPRKDPDSPTGIYIPKDLEEALVELGRLLPACFIKEFLARGPIHYHLSVGMWLRNNWGLWHHSRLAKYFNELGIRHPDDMSGIILTSYYRHLHQQPLRVEAQVKIYQAYWQLIREGWRPWKQLE